MVQVSLTSLNIPRFTPIILFLVLAAPWLSLSVLADEVVYPGEAYAKLDTFEAVSLRDADKLYIKNDYRGAYAAYKAYSTEFPHGKALPYALLRMGRCLHMEGKRNTAIKAYQDVVDYFPNDVRYAAAALFYIGQCHLQNGNEDQCLAVWAKMVKDKDYVQQANSGSALTALAEAMQKRGDFEEAASYQWRTAVNFRQSNPRAAEDARNSVVYHYVVRSPNQEKLLAFCNEVGGFGWQQRIDKPEENPVYWRHVLNVALGAKVEEKKREDVCRYWDAQMGDRFTENDSLRVDWFNVRLVYDKDVQAWGKRMFAQFELKPATLDRVRDWLGNFMAYPGLKTEFYQKYGQPLVAGLNNEQKLALVDFLRQRVRMPDEALVVLHSVRTQEMDDAALRRYAFVVVDFEGEEAFLRAVEKMKDKTAAAGTRFDFYYGRAFRNSDYQNKALAELPLLTKVSDNPQQFVWPHATLLQWQGQYEEAIKLYRKDNRQPESSWRIIDCRVAMKDYASAIQLAGELESLGGDIAAAACLRAADIYRSSGDKAKEVQQLQLVLRRYPKSGQSSTAHERLENYGVKLIGGESKAEE